jgi:hypothetical protein
MFAPLLEEHRLEDLVDKARQVYTEASAARAPPTDNSRARDGRGPGPDAGQEFVSGEGG